MYSAPNATLPITANADNIQTELACAPASNSVVLSIESDSPPTTPSNVQIALHPSPPTLLPSSHCSPGSTLLFPQSSGGFGSVKHERGTTIFPVSKMKSPESATLKVTVLPPAIVPSVTEPILSGP